MNQTADWTANDPLKRMRWSELERTALEAGVNLAVITRAKTRQELAAAIRIARGER